MEYIPFRILETKQSYAEHGDSIDVVERVDTVEVRLCKKFNTPGSFMNIEKIVGENDNIYCIYLHIIAPNRKSMLLQVVTYNIVTLEIRKEDLKISPPYIFKVKSDYPFKFTKGIKNI